VFVYGAGMKIDFEFETPYGKFADALWFPDDQQIPSEVEIEAMKQQRLNNWLAAITSPPADTPVEE
jgi:hypothetical protein